MSQATASIANQSRTLFRAAVNAIAQAIQSLNGGASAPTETYANMWWADATSGWLKQRDSANSAWIKRLPLGTGAAVDVASAATLDLDANAASSHTLRVTGTTTTTAITLADGQHRMLRAAGAWPITNGASLIVPGGSYTCAAGDLILAIGEPSGVVRLMIWKANGQAVVGSTALDKIVQVVEATPYTTYSSTATSFPYDDNIPQNTAGAQWNSVTITPTNASNRLRIEAEFSLVMGSGASDAAAAIFQDSTANALAASYIYTPAAYDMQMRVTHEMAAGTTSATTFKVRAGGNGTTFYVNGNASARKGGGTNAVRMRVTEIKP